MEKIKIPSNSKMKNVKERRKSLIKQTRDKIHNISRANAEAECIVCGDEIKKNQAFRALPKDKNCQEMRYYHLKTCGPGSNNWKIFKANGKKAPKKTLVQLSLKYMMDKQERG